MYLANGNTVQLGSNIQESITKECGWRSDARSIKFRVQKTYYCDGYSGFAKVGILELQYSSNGVDYWFVQ